MLRFAPIYHEELARLHHEDVLADGRERGVEQLAAESLVRVPLSTRAEAGFRHARAALARAWSHGDHWHHRHPPTRHVASH